MNVSLQAQEFAPSSQTFSIGSTFPDNFLTSKVAVMMEVPSTNTDEGPLWQQLAKHLHEALRLNGVDAVAYYRWQDLSAGPDATKAFMTEITGRGIKNVIIFRFKAAEGQYQLMVAPFNPDTNFYDIQQVSWGGSNAALEPLMQRFSFDLSQSGLEKENFLINELPEFFIDTRIFRNRRFESYNPDLKLDKLAVPKMSQETVASIDTSSLDKQLLTIMQQYPFADELADYEKGEDLLRNAGFQFVLLRLHSSASALQVLLDYPASKGDSLLSIRRTPDGGFSKSIEKDQLVYKYYIKHIYTGDVYLGNHWDADPNWAIALENHIFNLKSALKIKEN